MASPFYRYDNPQVGHFYTTNFNEMGNGKAGYTLERVECLLETEPVNGAIPLYRFLHNQRGTHFYTADRDEFEVDQVQRAYTDEGIAGYIYPTLVGEGHMVALYRYYNPANADHFLTTFREHRGSSEQWRAIWSGQSAQPIPGYNFELVAGYVIDFVG